MPDTTLRDNFDQLYIDYQPRLIAYAQRFVNDFVEAEDLVHDCFMNLWDKHNSVSPDEAVALLFVMTRNRCLNHLKHTSVANKYSFNYVAQAKVGEERLYNYNFEYNETEHPYLYQELESRIQQIVDSLPTRCREIFILSRFQGLKNREIAEQLNISLNTVEKHIQKALRIFAEALKHESVYLHALIVCWLISSGQ